MKYFGFQVVERCEFPLAAQVREEPHGRRLSVEVARETDDVCFERQTLARDVKLLSARGYRLNWTQPVDMFPWTEHVESVVLLSKVQK